VASPLQVGACCRAVRLLTDQGTTDGPLRPGSRHCRVPRWSDLYNTALPGLLPNGMVMFVTSLCLGPPVVEGPAWGSWAKAIGGWI
jgi:hypothetical protein